MHSESSNCWLEAALVRWRVWPELGLRLAKDWEMLEVVEAVAGDESLAVLEAKGVVVSKTEVPPW